MLAPSQGNASRPGPVIVVPRFAGTAFLHQFANNHRNWTIVDERWPGPRASCVRARGCVEF